MYNHNQKMAEIRLNSQLKEIKKMNIQKEEVRKKILKKHFDGQYADEKKFYDDLAIIDGQVSCQKEIDMMNQEEYKIIKDNRLIQKATFDYTEMEMKCLNFALSKLIPEVSLIENKNERWDLQFTFRELLDSLKIKDGASNYKLVSHSIFQLKEKTKRVKIERDNKTIYKPFNYFIDVEIEKEKDEKNIDKYLVRVKFDNNVIPFIKKMKNKFTELTLIYTLRLKGKYSMRMYELCKSWQAQGEFNFYIDKARVQWCIPEKYKTNDIKKRVIDKAIKEINEKTDIHIEIKETHKTNRITDWYVISIKQNENEIKIYQDIDRERKDFLQKQKER